MALKSRISTPLEAGTSILDAHRLPSYLIPALEYTSKRLANKGLCLTLVVARRDYQLPDLAVKSSTALPTRNPVVNLPTPPCSPTSPDSVACGLTSFKSLMRSGPQYNLETIDKPDSKQPQWRKARGLSKKTSLVSFLDGSIGLRWPMTPGTPSIPSTPATPESFATTTSSAPNSSTGETLEPQGPCIRLIHSVSLTPRTHKLVTATLARATRKFNLSTPLAAYEASTYNIPSVVLHGSILQNEVLYSSEGLTLLSMDHLYTFKSALSRYSTGRTEPGSDFRLEDAVDELRRYVLSSTGGRRRLLKSILVQAYDWLGPVNDFALGDVTEMYCRAYGGTAGETGVQDDLVKPNPLAVPTQVPEKQTIRGDGKLLKVEPSPTPPPQSSVSSELSVLSPMTIPNTPQSEQLLSPMSNENWVVEDYSPWGDEGMVNIPDTPIVLDTPVSKNEAGTPVDTLEAVKENDENGSDKSPIPATDTNDSEAQSPKTPQNIPHILISFPTPKAPSPRVSPKASLPALRVQTSFAELVKPKPKRKGTPVPTRRSPREKMNKNKDIGSKAADRAVVAVPPSPVSPTDKDIHIEIVADNDSDTDADLTEFEDGDLTARPPPSATSKTPVEAFWRGIDEVLGDKSAASSRPPLRHQRKSSSLQHDREGPTTPNGYEDISPITRGEWGFLMVSDPFRTKTAAVSCV